MLNVNLLEKVLTKYIDINSSYTKQRSDSQEFNVFNLINEIYGIGETKHSKFLAFLLNPYGDHGKGKLFLNEFLNILEIDDDSDSVWVVAAEKENIDVLLQRSYPVKSTIIIENKSNWAVDQDHQLYRYWYKKIHVPGKSYGNHEDVLGKHDRIVYLSPNKYKGYNKQSTQKPADLNCSLVSLFEENITTLYFSSDIKKWLEKCIKVTQSSERINYFLQNYLQFWQETNFKENLYMEELDEFFSNKKDDWINFVEAKNYISGISKNWLDQLVDEFQKIAQDDWKFEAIKPDDGELALNDFRWYLKTKSDLCFVYESHKGLTIWKKDFYNKKHDFKNELEQLFPGFSFVNDDSNYMMVCNGPLLVYHSEYEFGWIAGNETEDFSKKIENIIKPFMNSDDIKKFFRKVDETAV